MRYSYRYEIFATGWNRFACASWSAYGITATSLSAVRDSARKIWVNNPASAIYVVRTFGDNPQTARFYEYEIASGRLVPANAVVVLMAISQGPEHMPRMTRPR